jgi:hypothetical protein
MRRCDLIHNLAGQDGRAIARPNNGRTNIYAKNKKNVTSPPLRLLRSLILVKVAAPRGAISQLKNCFFMREPCRKTEASFDQLLEAPCCKISTVPVRNFRLCRMRSYGVPRNEEEMKSSFIKKIAKQSDA